MMTDPKPGDVAEVVNSLTAALINLRSISDLPDPRKQEIQHAIYKIELGKINNGDILQLDLRNIRIGLKTVEKIAQILIETKTSKAFF